MKIHCVVDNCVEFCNAPKVWTVVKTSLSRNEPQFTFGFFFLSFLSLRAYFSMPHGYSEL